MQRCEKSPGEDGQIDFTYPLRQSKTYLLLVWRNAFTRWVEAFPCQTERAHEMAKALSNEIVSRLGHPEANGVTMGQTSNHESLEESLGP